MVGLNESVELKYPAVLGGSEHALFRFAVDLHLTVTQVDLRLGDERLVVLLQLRIALQPCRDERSELGFCNVQCDCAGLGRLFKCPFHLILNALHPFRWYRHCGQGRVIGSADKDITGKRRKEQAKYEYW